MQIMYAHGGRNKQLSSFARVCPRPLINAIAALILAVSTMPDEEAHYDVDILTISAFCQRRLEQRTRKWRVNTIKRGVERTPDN